MERIGKNQQNSGAGLIVQETKLNRVITYGTFDLFHWGHKKLLERASRFGLLIVGLSTDEFNREKGKETVMTFEERKEVLKGVKYVDAIIKEECWEQKKKDIRDYNIDIFVIGDDWEGEFDDLPCRVVYLPRTQGISTSEIKKRLNNE